MKVSVQCERVIVHNHALENRSMDGTVQSFGSVKNIKLKFENLENNALLALGKIKAPIGPNYIKKPFSVFEDKNKENLILD